MALIAVILTVHTVSRQYVQPRYLLDSVDSLAWIAFPPDEIVRSKIPKVTKGDMFAKKGLPGKEFYLVRELCSRLGVWTYQTVAIPT